ncbi:MAG: hypothetical protein WBF33_23215 [Candidatus Nitrosopolaris sp.]
MSIRNYISKDNVEKIAIDKYRENGLGITIGDIEREFSVNKTKAQRKLKHFHGRGVLFTAKDLTLEGITALPNKNPQQYFPTCIKAEIIEDLVKRNNVLVNPTGVNHSSSPFSSDALNTTDQIVLQTLEGHILPLLPTSPSYIHNIHLKLSIVPQCYVELASPTISGNKGKKTTEVIGTSRVDYTFYPNGTVNVEVRCSNHPFRLQTEEDRSRLLVFLGQLRERLITILMDSHERIVPNVMEWELTECDINKDVKVSGSFHFTGPNIQVKYMDHLFSLYIKSMGNDTVYRIEERKHPHKPAIDFINDVLNPLERFEKMVSEVRKELKQTQ